MIGSRYNSLIKVQRIKSLIIIMLNNDFVGNVLDNNALVVARIIIAYWLPLKVHLIVGEVTEWMALKNRIEKEEFGYSTYRNLPFCVRNLWYSKPEKQFYYSFCLHNFIIGSISEYQKAKKHSIQ